MSLWRRNFFGTLAADPPWDFDNKASRGAAANHYPSMTVDEICTLRVLGRPVRDLVAQQSHCYLWVTAAHLFSGERVLNAWGFEYKLSIPWVKTKSPPSLQIGLGNWYRHAHELCLFGVRGKAKARVKNIPTVLFAPRGRHSAKPPELQARAERLSPGPYLELFSRSPRPGWESWGLEVALTRAG